MSVVGAGTDVRVVAGADTRVFLAALVDELVLVVAVEEDRRLDREPICVPAPLITVGELLPPESICVPLLTASGPELTVLTGVDG